MSSLAKRSSKELVYVVVITSETGYNYELIRNNNLSRKMLSIARFGKDAQKNSLEDSLF